MQDFYNPLLIHAQNQCWNGRVIAPCTTLFLIKKKLHVLETLYYESQRGKKIHDIYEETHFFPWLPVSFLTRFLNYSETFLPPIHSSLTYLNFSSWILCCPGHYDVFTLSSLTPGEYKDKQPWSKQHRSHIFVSCSLRTPLYGSETGRLFGEWQQKKIHNIGLHFPYVQRQEEGAIQGRKFSYKGKGTGWVLEGFQGMEGCLQSWRPRGRKD